MPHLTPKRKTNYRHDYRWFLSLSVTGILFIHVRDKRAKPAVFACKNAASVYNETILLMNTTHLITLALAGAVILPACQQNYGSVDAPAVRETLASPRLSVTPATPDWLQEQQDNHPLTAQQMTRLRTLLQDAPVRKVPERYYRSAGEGNRGDSTENVFYIYGSNEQCLGGRVLPGRVMMDDLELEEPAQQELYKLLRPQLKKLFNPLP